MIGEITSEGAAVADVADVDVTATWIRPGGVARFYAWCYSLPWHGWWLFPTMAGALLVWEIAILWGTGRLPVGTLDPTLTVSVAYGPYMLAALGYLNRVAGRAVNAFWPATGWPDKDRASWAEAFMTVRAGLGLPSLIIGIVIAIAVFQSAPASIVGTDTFSRLTYAVALFPIGGFGYAMAVLAIAHTSRQLRLVVTIHREARAIDPFDRGPVYAFSLFTAQIGLAFLLTGYYTLTFNESFQSGNLVVVFVLGLVLALSAACFILPLWGIHERLVAEKVVLFAGLEDRVNKLAAELYRRIDAGEFDGTKVISEAIASAGSVRERIAKLPTWPWPPQLIRGFISALLLPVIVYLITRLIGGQIGA